MSFPSPRARQDSQLDVWVRDDGPGIQNKANVFVPFFTTKPGGTGIGLALSRQIAEAHGGTLTLRIAGMPKAAKPAISGLPICEYAMARLRSHFDSEIQSPRS